MKDKRLGTGTISKKTSQTRVPDDAQNEMDVEKGSDVVFLEHEGPGIVVMSMDDFLSEVSK